MLVLYNPSCLLHATVELLGARLIPALERPERITAIVEALSASTRHTVRTVDFDQSSSSSTDTDALVSLIVATHSAAYVQHLSSIFQAWCEAGLISPESDDAACILPECFALPRPHGSSAAAGPPRDVFARVGYYAFDMSSGVNAHTYAAVLGAANLAREGVRLLSTETTTTTDAVLALTRPPGHHCDGARSGGYCYVNNAAVAVTAYHQTAGRGTGRESVAILDLDFHHGNGTQAIFYADPRVLYVSIHGRDEFPYYTGSAGETGVGAGAGYNLNLPLEPRQSSSTGSGSGSGSFAEYARLLDVAIARIRQHAPAFLVISLGFDTFHLDPLGSFAIDTGDYETMARAVRSGLAKQHGGPVEKTLILLEGGYVVDRLGENMLSFLRGWEEDAVPK